MSDYLDGLSNMYTLTAQINALKNQQTSTNSTTGQASSIDPKEALYKLQLNFNEMLNGLISSDKDKEEEKSDFFDFFTDYQTSVNQLNNQNNQSSQAQSTNNPALNVNSYTGSIDNIF